MLQRLPITPTQLNAGNTSKNFLTEICQIFFSFQYSFYRAK